MKVAGFKDTIDWYRNNIQKYTLGYYQFQKTNKLSFFTKQLPKGGLVLDAGCAAGRDSKYLLEEGLEVIGIDLVDEFVQKAKEHAPTGTFITGSFLNLPFEDELFDGVWANASLLHFETINEVKKALKEFYRILKGNGTLYVNVKAQIDSNKFKIVNDSLSKHDRFFQFFTLDEVRSLMKVSGFQVSKIEQYNEKDEQPKVGRSEVEWISCLARKR
ncbi:MAG: class I SAM-dependent methyltransferase [bacterium]|nr:class I SAM-dependent methyltransferase [bacterium]